MKLKLTFTNHSYRIIHLGGVGLISPMNTCTCRLPIAVIQTHQDEWMSMVVSGHISGHVELPEGYYAFSWAGAGEEEVVEEETPKVEYTFSGSANTGAYFQNTNEIAYAVEGSRVSHQSFVAYMERNGRHQELAEWMEKEKKLLADGYVRTEPRLI